MGAFSPTAENLVNRSNAAESPCVKKSFIAPSHMKNFVV